MLSWIPWAAVRTNWDNSQRAFHRNYLLHIYGAVIYNILYNIFYFKYVKHLYVFITGFWDSLTLWLRMMFSCNGCVFVGPSDEILLNNPEIQAPWLILKPPCRLNPYPCMVIMSKSQCLASAPLHYQENNW